MTFLFNKKKTRDDLDLIIDYYHVDDLPKDLIEWTFQLVKSNLYDM